MTRHHTTPGKGDTPRQRWPQSWLDAEEPRLRRNETWCLKNDGHQNREDALALDVIDARQSLAEKDARIAELERQREDEAAHDWVDAFAAFDELFCPGRITAGGAMLYRIEKRLRPMIEAFRALTPPPRVALGVDPDAVEKAFRTEAAEAARDAAILEMSAYARADRLAAEIAELRTAGTRADGLREALEEIDGLSTAPFGHHNPQVRSAWQGGFYEAVKDAADAIHARLATPADK